VRLTDAGRERFAKAFPAASRQGEEIFSILKDDELTALRSVAGKLREAALKRLNVSLEGL
jgi:DNA-binding MarR family transcriptional regulator